MFTDTMQDDFEEAVAKAAAAQVKHAREIAQFLRSNDPSAKAITNALNDMFGDSTFMDKLADRAESEAKLIEESYLG